MNLKTNATPLVSIIVPAYNVEKYVSNCIESLLSQTYSHIEVILVNDGSQDSTPDILDQYSSRDPRVQVFHKENQGVSSARNTGIRESKGDFLVFVDGDDYLASDYISYMLSLVEKTGSEFCFSKNCYTSRGERQCEPPSVQTLGPEEATALLLSPDVVVGCWNKIYKRSLLVSNGIEFSSSLFYGEGLTFITQVSQLPITVGVGNRKVYYYRRNNEASATTEFSIDKIYNGEKALIAIHKSLTINSRRVKLMFNYHLSLYRLGALVRLKSNKVEEEYAKDYKRWLKYIRKNTVANIFFWQVSIYRKVLMICGCISPSLLSFLDAIRRRRIKKISVNG